MAQINTSSLFNGTRGFDFTLNGLNTLSNYLLGDFILISIFLLIIFTLRENYFTDGMISASVVTLLLSFALWSGGFIEYTRVVICFVVFIIAISMSYIKN